jgi:3-oxoacyl-[acyl-carrier-protein] synthase II
VLSDGAGVLILESLDFVMKRGAEPLAEIIARAATTDGTHLTAPDEGATQAARAIRRALDKARLGADEIETILAICPPCRLRL